MDLGLEEFVHLWLKIVEGRVMGLCLELKDGLMSYLMAIWWNIVCEVLGF